MAFMRNEIFCWLQLHEANHGHKNDHKAGTVPVLLMRLRRFLFAVSSLSLSNTGFGEECKV